MALTPRRISFTPGKPLRILMLAMAAAAPALSGCNGFFVYPGTVTSTTTTTSCTAAAATTSTSTIYGYVSNSSCGNAYLNGYVLGSGTLTAATSSPYNLGITPESIAITPTNTYMYIASDPALTTGDIYGWSLGSGGAISVLSGGTALYPENSAALAVSADGKYLFSLNSDGVSLEQYTIGSGGTLTLAGNYSLSSSGTVVPTGLAFAPSGDFLVATLGTGGADVFAYNSSTGALSTTATTVINVANSSIGINGVAIDGNNYIYAATTTGLAVFSTTAGGAATLLNTYTVGNGAHGVAVNPANSFVYVANFSDSTISAFSIGTNGTLTAVSGSPFSGPSNVVSLGITSATSAGSYLVADGYNSTNGIRVYSIGSGGALTQTASTGSGTNTTYPAVLGLTH